MTFPGRRKTTSPESKSLWASRCRTSRSAQRRLKRSPADVEDRTKGGKLRVLVVGGGGREHAIVAALADSPSVSQVLCAPGNPGIEESAECFSVKADDVPGLVELARRTVPDLVAVGPEAPLAAGLADAIGEEFAVFGPSQKGARLESSKSSAKALMARKGIPTAGASTFDRPEEAIRFVEEIGGPVVVKADGLAAGKGVFVADTAREARHAIEEAMIARRFGPAGAKVLIEERLFGPELSILAFCDGKTVLPMEPAQDFKRALDGDRGPNTGGMGSYSPVPICTPELFDQAADLVLGPISEALAEEGEHYVGVLYAGLMLTEQGLKVIEFNCRFGDPETQALLPRLKTDLASAMLASVEGSLAGAALEWRSEACVTVVAASRGYPDEKDIPAGLPIEGLSVAGHGDIRVFHSGTARQDGAVVTAGGRVLSVSALGSGIQEARRKAYEHMKKISFEGMHYRADIAAAAAALEAGTEQH